MHLHRVDKVRWSRRVNVTENVEHFRSKCYHFTATKTSVTVSVKQYEHDRVTRCTFFCCFQIKKDDITIVAQHVRDLFTTAAERPSQRRDRIGYLEPWIFENEFRNIFPKIYGIPGRPLRNDALKYPKLSQDGMLNISRWYKPMVTFTAVGL